MNPSLRRYATIREEAGRCYLYIKTIERAHTPAKLWQKIRLKRQYADSLAQVMLSGMRATGAPLACCEALCLPRQGLP